MDYLENLRRIQNEMADRHDRVQWVKPEKGKDLIIRFLPYSKDAEGQPVFFKTLAGHFMAPDVGPRSCPKHTNNEGDECPICDWVEANLTSEDERREALARRIRVQFSYAANVLIYTPGSGFDPRAKVIKLTENVFNMILSLILADGNEGMLDPIKGHNITIKGVSTGPQKMNVKYSVSPSMKPTPLGDKETVREMLKSVKNLDILFGRMPSEEELKDALISTKNDREFVTTAIADRRAQKEIWAKAKKDKSEARAKDSSLFGDD